MLIIFCCCGSQEEEEKTRKILLAASIDEEDWKLFNITSYDPVKVVEGIQGIRNVITFGRLARKGINGIVDKIDNLLELGTASDLGRYTTDKKKEVIEKIKVFSEKEKELKEYTNIGNIEIRTEGLELNKEKVVALIAEKQKDKKYIAYLKDKTIIEISEKKELKESIHMTIEDLFTLLVMKDVLGATIVEIRRNKGEENA